MIPTNQLGDLLIEINKYLKIKIERDFKSYGIGMGQLQILMVFYSNMDSHFSQNDLVKILSTDKGNISRSVAKLQEKNYLEFDATNARLYKLTTDGIALKTVITTSFISINEAMVNGIDETILDQTLMTLNKISKQLEAII